MFEEGFPGVFVDEQVLIVDDEGHEAVFQGVERISSCNSSVRMRRNGR